MWDNDKFMSFDFETSGGLPEYALQPWRVAQSKAWATSLVAARVIDGKAVITGGLDPTADTMREMLETAIAEKRTLVGWNTAFDISWLLAYGLHDLVFKCKWLDGMLLWRHFFIEPEYEMERHRKRSYGLKQCVAEVLPQHAGYEEDVDFHSTDPEERRKLHEYNVRDTLFTLRLAKHWYNKLATNPQQLKAAIIEAECLPLVAEANLKGMVVDTLAARELQQSLVDTAARQLSKLAPHGVTEKVVRSPMQLAKLLFDDWGLKPLKENVGAKTGKVSRATDKETLHELSFEDERAKELKAYREALNNKTKFADTPLLSVEYNGDGRTHPGAIVFGTYSGRLTYASNQGRNKYRRQTGFALHQEKRGAEFRGIIIPPPGYTLLEFDASGQEFRWMAIAANDPVMLDLCQPGGDPHSFMGARIERVNYEQHVSELNAGDKHAKDRRQLGKVANLCLAEGTVVLTDRGPCNIEHVQADDLIWDGVEFVDHDGVVCSGVKPVLSYAGVTATPDHRVYVDGRWVQLAHAARYGWTIEPALGSGWARRSRSAVRILGGLVARHLREVRRAVRDGALQLWGRPRGEPAVSRNWSVGPMQSMRNPGAASAGWPRGSDYPAGQTPAEACQRVVSAVPQPQGPLMEELRRAGDQMPFWFGRGSDRVHQRGVASPDVSGAGHRPGGQRRSLRTWKLALGYTKGEPSQSSEARVYDIVNCGPRTRFAANGLIVHNSLQYRTSAKKLRSVARVQYGMPMEMAQAELIHRTYQQTYRRVPDYWDRQIYQTRLKGYVETFAGRRVQVMGNWEGKNGWSMGSTSINYRIQGTGADQKYLALAVLKPYLVRIGAAFAWDLHDGVYLYVPTRHVERAAVEIKYLLDNLPYQKAWGFTPPIGLPWDCKSGHSWGSLKEWKYG